MTTPVAERELKEIPLGLIDSPVLPSRSTMDEVALDELAASIRRHGLLQPMVVGRVGDRFEVIAGHRRFLACGRAGLVVAPAIVYASVDAAKEGLKYAENRFREELSPADEAIWFSELLERDCGGDVDQLCAQLHEKRSYVENRLALLAGDPQVFEALQQGKIKVGVAQQLNRCTHAEYRRWLLHQAIVGGATVAVVVGWITDWQRQHAVSNGAATPTPAPDAAVPIDESNFFRCEVCGETTDVHVMRPVNIHQHCKKAILDPLLKSYRGEA